MPMKLANGVLARTALGIAGYSTLCWALLAKHVGVWKVQVLADFVATFYPRWRLVFLLLFALNWAIGAWAAGNLIVSASRLVRRQVAPNQLANTLGWSTTAATFFVLQLGLYLFARQDRLGRVRFVFPVGIGDTDMQIPRVDMDVWGVALLTISLAIAIGLVNDVVALAARRRFKASGEVTPGEGRDVHRVGTG